MTMGNQSKQGYTSHDDLSPGSLLEIPSNNERCVINNLIMTLSGLFANYSRYVFRHRGVQGHPESFFITEHQ